MPVVKHEPDFAELVDLAAERRNRLTENWNQAISDLYGAAIDPITAYFYKCTAKIPHLDNKSLPPVDGSRNSSTTPSAPAAGSSGDVPLPPTKTLKYSSLAYLLIIGPLMYPRGFVICFAILTLLFRLSDHTLRESTADLSDTLDLIINIYFIFEGITRLCTIPAVFEIRRRHFESNERPANSLAYEILRCGWIEILISLLSIAISSQYQSTNAICWFNLFRLSFIANFFVLELPQIEVLLSGIYSGLRSIASTWFLLIITFVIYGVLCTASFRDNDPGHFSTVGTSMFTLFRVSTMDNWSEVNYINAYGCDSVPSNYIRISRNDTRPRYIDVFSGRMYLFLCDTPTYHPYLSSFIFTSFVVLTGFMLISLTVAAVSGGVHMRLEEVQKEDDENGTEIDIADDLSDVDEPPKKEEEKEIRRTMRTHTFFGKGPDKGPNVEQLRAKLASATLQSPPTAQPEISLERPSLMRISSVAEEGDEEKEDDEDESEEKSESNRMRTYSDIEPDINLQKDKSISSVFNNENLIWQTSASSDTDDELDIVIRKVSKADVSKSIEELIREESSEPQEPIESLRTITSLPSTPQLSLQSLSTQPDNSPPVENSVATSSPKITRNARKSMKPALPVHRNSIKVQLPLLQDKELLRMMLTQTWTDIEHEKENNADDSSPDVTEEAAPPSRLTRLLSSMSDPSTSRPSVKSPGRLNQPMQPGRPSNTPLVRHSSFHQHSSDTLGFNSTKKIAYFLKNFLSTYYYIGYMIMIVLVTASFQIYCTNKNNCSDYWGVFIAVQILLSFDIFVRIVTYFPTYRNFFFSRNNLFDMFVVLIIWIPIYYTGYGSQIAESARIVYLLRLLPFLAWITDLQVIMLSIVSSIRPLLYVVGMMFLMFFHFSVAGVLIFKRNDEFYFGTLYRAMNALFQVCTLDNWGDIALKNMYGCDYYGSDTGIDEVDSMCQTPQGLGWIAAWYFLIFITFSVMILQSLFVGIIISAMELLKDGVSQEAEMWKLIYQRVDKFGLQNSTLMNLLEIFNALDTNLNGYVLVPQPHFFSHPALFSASPPQEKDLDPILRVLPPMPTLPHVNCRIKGQYTFPEFMDLIHVIGIKLHKVSRSPR